MGEKISAVPDIHQKRQKYVERLMKPLQVNWGKTRAFVGETMEAAGMQRSAAEIVAVANADMAKEAKEQARFDDLTGLLRRGAFVNSVEEYRQTKAPAKAVIVFFDIDNFKY